MDLLGREIHERPAVSRGLQINAGSTQSTAVQGLGKEFSHVERNQLKHGSHSTFNT